MDVPSLARGAMATWLLLEAAENERPRVVCSHRHVQGKCSQIEPYAGPTSACINPSCSTVVYYWCVRNNQGRGRLGANGFCF